MERETRPRLPRLERYLAEVPGGLAAHPGALARGVLIRTGLEGEARTGLLDVLPEPLQRLVLDPPMDSEWVPEVHFVAFNQALADYRGLSDDEFRAWVRGRNRVLYASHFFRMMMAVLSPETLLRFIGARWSTLHRGTSLALRASGPGQAHFELRFPPRLFDPLAVGMFTEALVVALELTRVRGPQVTVESADACSAHLLAQW